MSEINQLRWRCRRGVLELDLMLTRYLDSRYANAGLAEQTAFQHLLALEDNDLLHYLLGEAQPHAVEFVELVACIRALPAE